MSPLPHHLFPSLSLVPSLSPFFFSGLLFQVLSVLLSLVGDVLVSVYRSEREGKRTQGCSMEGGAGPDRLRLEPVPYLCSQELGLGPWGGGWGILWGLPAPPAPLRFLREVCSIRFLLTAVSLLSLFLAGERGPRFPRAPALEALKPNPEVHFL